MKPALFLAAALCGLVSMEVLSVLAGTSLRASAATSDASEFAPMFPLCQERHGGAQVYLENDGDKNDNITLWVSNQTHEGRQFIEEAELLLEEGARKVPMLKLQRGKGPCDAKWTWHVDEDVLEFADMATEVCDARADFVEEEREYWLNTVKSWCPWSFVVKGVQKQ